MVPPLSARRSRVHRLLLLLLVAGLALSCAEKPRLNLVLVSLDTMTPERMSAYGAERPTTPETEKLAAAGVRFTHAYSPSPWTLPAHAAMLTGRYPSSLTPDPNDARIYGIAPLLSHRFEEAGYATGAVTGGLYVSDKIGAGRGFDSFQEGNVLAAIRWAESHSHEPFFLFFHTYTAHVPFHDERFVGDLEGGWIEKAWDHGKEKLSWDVCCREELSEEERAYVRARYDGDIAKADEELGRLVRALERVRVLDRTVVIVTSDHGEEFWRHTPRGAYHGHTLYDELLHVPLIWVEPGLPDPGRTVATPVSLIDIVPTVVERFGLASGGVFDGVDLSPLLEGDDWDLDRVLVGEGTRHGPERLSVRSDEGKLIVTPDPSTQRGHGTRYPVPVKAPRELYLPEDAEEREDRAAQNPELVSRLAEQLEAWRNRPGAAAAAPTTPPPEVDDEMREALKRLGYVE